MVTMKDIAREAGVSHGTVSNVINKTGKVSAEKMRLVEDAIKRLGYVPNVQASMLRQGKPSTIAVIIPSLRENIYQEFYLAVESQLKAAGYKVSLYITNDIDSIELSILNEIRIAGIVAVFTVSTLHDKCCAVYQSISCPVIYIERCPASMRNEDAFYGFDYMQVIEHLTQKIVAEKWKKIAFFCTTSLDLFLRSTGVAAKLSASAKSAGCSVAYFCSDFDLALPKAFDIIQAKDHFDAVFAFGSVPTACVSTVFALYGAAAHPKLISIGTAATQVSREYESYLLDYYQLGCSAAAHLENESQNAVQKKNLLSPRGFLFEFKQIQPNQKQEISLLTVESPTTSALRKLLPMFEEISGIHVDLIVTSYDEQHMRLKRDGCYDMVRLDVAEFEECGRQLYIPLTQALTSGSISERLCQGRHERYSLIDGTVYALPFDPSVQMLLYRKDLFSDALLKRAYYETYREVLSVPESIEQYLRVAQFFTREATPLSPTPYGATATVSGAPITAASDFLPYYLGNGGTITQDGRLTALNSPIMVKALQSYSQMQAFTCKENWWGDSLRKFCDGKAATAIIYSNYISGVINSKHSKVVGQTGVAIVPGKAPLLGGGVLGITQSSQKIDACLQFLIWYYSEDISSMILRLGGTSPLVDVYHDFENIRIYPWLPTIEEGTSLGIRGTEGVTVPDYTIRRYEFSIGTAVQKLIRGECTPDQAAVVAQTLYEFYDVSGGKTL